MNLDKFLDKIKNKKELFFHTKKYKLDNFCIAAEDNILKAVLLLVDAVENTRTSVSISIDMLNNDIDTKNDK